MRDKLVFNSQVIFKKKLSELPVSYDNDFLLYDRVLLRSQKKFIENFPYSFGVDGGESAKDFGNFSRCLTAIISRWPQVNRKNSRLLVLGGGSIGDLGGFVAAVLKRGVRLVHIPSTWLSAIDSAHGGKNGLNFNGVKNQLGTFYPPEKVFVCQDVLWNQPDELTAQALGEFVKMGLIGHSRSFNRIARAKKLDKNFYWSLLKPLIKDKYKIVLRDPYEKTQIRQVLNFGHSLGHVVESHYGWSHGESVMQGLLFSLDFSLRKKILSKDSFRKIDDVLVNTLKQSRRCEESNFRPLSQGVFLRLLMADKKSLGKNRINWIFLKNLGQPVVKSVDVSEALGFAKHQGWVR